MRKIFVSDVMAVVASHYRISEESMRSPCRKRMVAWPRQVAMALARDLTGKSYPVLGGIFGSRDHTTIMYAVRKVASVCETDVSFKRKLDMLRGRLI